MSLPLDPQIRENIVDVHCHPTDSPYSDTDVQSCPIKLCAMASNIRDQHLVKNLAQQHPDKIIPAFGYHPWWSHHIAITPSASKEAHYRSLFLTNASSSKHHEAFDRLLPSLPDPTNLEDILSTLEANLEQFPTSMVGEVGLDRTMRVPFVPESDSEGGARALSPFKIPVDHQLQILEAQLKLAVKYRRHVSFHSVNAQSLTASLLDRMTAQHKDDWLNISVDMHSCGLSAEMWGTLEKANPNVFLSLSTAINGRSSSLHGLIQACSDNRILAESDYNQVTECAGRTWEMMKIIADVKHWRIEDRWEDDADPIGVVRHLAQNWQLFLSGGHKKARLGKNKSELLYDSEEE